MYPNRKKKRLRNNVSDAQHNAKLDVSPTGIHTAHNPPKHVIEVPGPLPTVWRSLLGITQEMKAPKDQP